VDKVLGKGKGGGQQGKKWKLKKGGNCTKKKNVRQKKTLATSAGRGKKTGQLERGGVKK